MHGEYKLVPRTRVCAVEIWCEVLNRQRGDMTKSITREINALLERIPGWSNVGVRDAGKPYGKQRCFEKDPTTNSNVTATF